MKVFTWNTQGNFQQGTKWEDVLNLMVQCDVGLIQEGGGDASGGEVNLGHLFAVKGAAPGALNTRCCNWTISKQEGTAWYSRTLGGGVAARQAAGIILDGTLLVSWHSTAISEMDEDTSALFREIIDDVLKPGQAARALIGADFNTPLPNMIQVANSATSGRMRGAYDNCIFHSGDSTHQNGSTLDYFVMLQGSEPGNAPHMIEVYPIPESDHHPVVLSIE